MAGRTCWEMSIMTIRNPRRLQHRVWTVARQAFLYASVIACGVLVAGEPVV